MSEHPRSSLSVWQAILIGHLVITVPVIVAMLYFAWLGPIAGGLIVAVIKINELFWLIRSGIILIGFIVAWVWWSVMVPRWRKWALQKGIPADELQKWGVRTGLLWPKGSALEKTEIKTWDKD
jgi:hypothetical protein